MTDVLYNHVILCIVWTMHGKLVIIVTVSDHKTFHIHYFLLNRLLVCYFFFNDFKCSLMFFFFHKIYFSLPFFLLILFKCYGILHCTCISI